MYTNILKNTRDEIKLIYHAQGVPKAPFSIRGAMGKFYIAAQGCSHDLEMPCVKHEKVLHLGYALLY